MLQKNLPGYVFAALVAAFALRVARLWPQLPESIATHFDVDGRANGWSSANGLLGILAFQVGVFLALFVLVGRMILLPDKNFRLPNKDRWLAPGRRDGTLRFIILWTRSFLVLAFAFIAWITVAALEANLKPTPHLDLSHAVVIIFAALALSMVAGLFARFMSRG